MKYFKNWSELGWFSKTLVLMAILAAIGFVVHLSGYYMIGGIVIWSAVAVNIVALIIAINLWREQ